MGLYYNRKGEPIEVSEWVRLFESDTVRHVDVNTIDGVHVSTVFLGLNHQWGIGPPLIFETMIFGGPHDQYQERYSTEEAAFAGHDRIVTALREGKDP